MNEMMLPNIRNIIYRTSAISSPASILFFHFQSPLLLSINSGTIQGSGTIQSRVLFAELQYFNFVTRFDFKMTNK